ncbi:ZIP family metal transporter [archaeon]|jgi:zinc and cadmium transporter|nr:ZIP family metal transporter [archaeon]MBT3730654.1 ZIP family metal transporter [archaeon]MBT4669556.1 ZIP family metal transporter [archaeon]MBT5030313.1 ZIP family metal transporter [archaeon]MBT5288394.1 ZIP family metal transporter [archaeon]
MLEAWLYSIISVIIVSLISLIGIFTFILKKKNIEKISLYLVSLAAGALLGDAFIHLIPESFAVSSSIVIPIMILVGIFFSFITEKYIHWHHCHCHDCKKHIKPFAYVNLLGDSLHNFIDGIIIGTSYLISIPIGIATTIAIIFHEIPQEIGDLGVLIHAGLSKKKALLVNFITALTSLLGVILALALTTIIDNLTLYLIPFAAGTFIYIASTDLIPELHKEVKWEKSIIQTLLILLGIVLMLLLSFFN